MYKTVVFASTAVVATGLARDPSLLDQAEEIKHSAENFLQKGKKMEEKDLQSGVETLMNLVGQFGYQVPDSVTGHVKEFINKNGQTILSQVHTIADKSDLSMQKLEKSAKDLATNPVVTQYVDSEKGVDFGKLGKAALQKVMENQDVKDLQGDLKKAQEGVEAFSDDEIASVLAKGSEQFLHYAEDQGYTMPEAAKEFITSKDLQSKVASALDGQKDELMKTFTDEVQEAKADMSKGVNEMLQV